MENVNKFWKTETREENNFILMQEFLETMIYELGLI